MPKPVSEWTEDDVLSLPPGENDTFERKGANLLDLTIPSVNEGRVLDELAKQLSAFSNTGGGQIVYGIADGGVVDNGGIARTLRGRQSTKEWLEDVIPGLTDFEIVGFNVYEIPPRTSGSQLAPDKSIYLIDVPDSERAPHQSRRDLKYYVRLGGKSPPASHRIIEDIRNRRRHPRLEIHNVEIFNASSVPPWHTDHLTNIFEVHLTFRLGLRNTGRVRASNSCLRISGTVPIQMVVGGDECMNRPTDQGNSLLEVKNPVYPGMGVVLTPGLRLPASVEVRSTEELFLVAGRPFQDLQLFITIFADSAPPHKQVFKWNEMNDSDKCIDRLIKEAVRRINQPQRPSPSYHGGPWG